MFRSPAERLKYTNMWWWVHSRSSANKALFTHNFLSLFLSAAPLTFSTFVMCEQHQRNSFNPFWNGEKDDVTRMHSSRMRTARSSSRLGGMGGWAGGSLPGPPRTRHTPRDHAPPRTMHPPDHAPPRTMPLPVNRITHACENITLPQLRCGR